MHIINCLNPVSVRNKATGSTEVVPCGKCELCLNRKSSIWIQRLNVESACHKYVVFLTLTYNNDNVPTLTYDSDGNVLVDTVTGLLVDVSKYGGVSLRSYLRKRCHIQYLSVRDCQLFFKRLRLNIKLLHEKEKSSEPKEIRYYLAGEYGPTTLRPHYHALLFFDSSLTSTRFEELLHSSWQCGICDWSFVRSQASSYVAKYVNSFPHLPSFYSDKQIKPFSIFSKCPPLGTLQIDEAQIRQIFTCGLVERTIFDTSKKQYVDVPLWRSLQDRLFPKFAGFSKVSNSTRVALYGLVQFSKAESFEEFKEFCLKTADIGLEYCSQLEFFQTLSSICYSNCDSDNDYPLKNLYYASKRVLAQSSLFGIKLSDYVLGIDVYYSNKALYRLAKQLEFEQEFARQFGCSQLIYLDPVFVSRTTSVFGRSMLTNGEIITLESFGVDVDRWLDDVDYRRSLDIFNNPNERSFIEQNKWIFRRSQKTKKKNDYLELHPEYRYF